MSAAPLFKKKGAGRRDVRPRGDGSGPSADADPRSNAEGSHRRERPVGDGDDEARDATVVVAKKRKLGGGAGNPLLQGTFSARLARDDLNGKGDDDDDEYGTLTGLGESEAIRADGVLDRRKDATRTSDWYDGDEGQALKSGPGSTAKNDDGVYRGSANYSKYVTEHDDGKSSKIRAANKGPVRAGGSNVRTITTVDYQPDVCKDYKETGYCGFGDTCKFLHDRSDYLAGWQLDSLSNGGRRREALLDDDDDDEEQDDIPFACLICRKHFVDPVVTKCGHFFCSACAVKRYSKTSKCFACGQQTQGIFNSATKILQRMEKVRALKEEEREEKRWDRDDRAEVAEQDGGELLEGVEVGESEGE